MNREKREETRKCTAMGWALGRGGAFGFKRRGRGEIQVRGAPGISLRSLRPLRLTIGGEFLGLPDRRTHTRLAGRSHALFVAKLCPGKTPRTKRAHPAEDTAEVCAGSRRGVQRTACRSPFSSR